MGPDDRAAAVAFLREHTARTAARSVRLPWGFAVFDDELPLVWDANLVWVDAVPADLSAARLAAEVERLLGGSGLGHRNVVVADEAGGRRLGPGLRASGWTWKQHILMVHRRPPDRSSGPAPAREIGVEAARAFTEAGLRGDPGLLSAEAIRQLGAAKATAAANGARFFGAEVGGVLASVCDLYADRGVAQIEAVVTLAEHRNRGLARAVVLRALAAARAAGHGLVFLQAEEDDWPKELYARLGFDPVGRTHVFLRVPS
jgi:GNAT superfamily N-acetyltransferase